VYNPTGVTISAWINDPEALAAKTRAALFGNEISGGNIGGVGAWQLDQDTDDAELISGLHSAAKGKQGKIDLILCIDNTGSMWDDIAAAKSAATEIVNAVLEEVDARIALVTYKDFPISPYGGSSDYIYKDVVPFTKDSSALINGINSMYASGGADWEESVYSALMHCIDSTSLGGWRGEPIKKAIIVMGDAPPHDPEPFTGYTIATVVQAAEDADPVILYPVLVGSDSTAAAYFSGLAEGTGGEMFSAANASEVVDAILEAIKVIKYSPFADAGGPYEGTPGEPIEFDASGSYDPDGEIVLYEWDWDSDGIYDCSSGNPVCEHTWDLEFSGTVRLRVTDNDGLSSIDTATVVVKEPEPVCVDGLVSISSGLVSYDRRTGQFSVNVTVKNTSATVVNSPVWLVIESISNPAVTLAGADGTTADGKPYLDLSGLLVDGKLSPAETITKRLYFNNPTRVKFTFTPSVRGVILP
jgi:hypothetical protein